MNNTVRTQQIVKEIMEKGDVRDALKSGSGYNSNIFGDRNRIYSYGYHYVIATYVRGKWFLNSINYSRSTGRHSSLTLRAIIDNGVNPEDIIHAPLKSGTDDNSIISSSISGCLRNLESLKEEVSRTRKGSGNNLRLQAEIEQAEDTISKLVIIEEMSRTVNYG